MKTLRTIITAVAITLLLVIAPTSCSMIDDDRSDCGANYEIDYELRLVTNLSTELETVLNTDAEVKAVLRDCLKDIFTDKAHDVDLSFYNTLQPFDVLHHEEHVMDANQSSYTLQLPVREYQHLAVANILDNSMVNLEGSDRSVTASLQQSAGTPATAPAATPHTPATRADRPNGTIIGSHTTGLFTARLPMSVLSGQDQSFNVRLYMANCATALVIDHSRLEAQGAPLPQDIKVYTTGFATSFELNDSVYHFSQPSPFVEATGQQLDHGSLFYTVNFPSREPAGAASRLILETEEPFLTTDIGETLWQYIIYITKADGTVQTTALNVGHPLRSGQLKVVKAFLDDDYNVRLYDVTTGVSVRLDWNDNNYGEIPL